MLNILVVINESWGEVDWLLPVLDRLYWKKRAKIWTLFLNNAIFEDGTDYLDLRNDLLRVSQRVLKPAMFKAQNRLDNFLPVNRDYLTQVRRSITGPVDVVLHEYGGENFSEIYEVFPEAVPVIFPHGTFIYGWVMDNLKKQHEKFSSYDLLPRTSVLLVGTELDQEYFSDISGLENIHVVGHPKLDEQWFRKRSRESNREQEGAWIGSANANILFLQYPARRFSSIEKFSKLTRTVLEQGQRLSMTVNIRRHPRQDIEEIQSLLNSGDRISRVNIASESILACAMKSLFSVGFPTSGCMDAIAAGIPAIEFFDFEGETWSTFARHPGGKNTSVFRNLELVMGVDSRKELEATIDSLLTKADFRKEISEYQKKCLEEITGIGRESVNKCVSVIQRSVGRE